MAFERYAHVADDLTGEALLMAGVSPQRVLLAYYDDVLNTKLALDLTEYREAREAIARAPWAFFIDLARATKRSLASIVKLFKKPIVAKFFGAIKWSFKKLFDLLKRGYKSYKGLQDAIGDYIAQTRVGKWTKDEFKKLDEFLKRHPKTKKIAGVALAGLLVYFWFNQSFSGDPAFDFDMSYIIDSINGNFSLENLFAGPQGTKLLIAVTLGFATGVTLPWPGPGTIKFIMAILGTLSYKLGIRMKKQQMPPEEEQKLLTSSRKTPG